MVFVFWTDGFASAEQGFDYLAYLSANSDLPSNWSKTDCMNHYIIFGFNEKRAVTFNLEEYLNANPDLPKEWTYETALYHYNVFGKSENRLLAFDAQEYLSLYPDLPQNWSYVQAYSHYMIFGRYEKRIPSFDETAYLEMYTDLPREWGQTQAFTHYLLFGLSEGRAYDPYDEDVFAGSSNSDPVKVWYRDNDNDGYSDGTSQDSASRPGLSYYLASELSSVSGDLDDSDGSIYPGAPEKCGDGIDQDCDGNDAACEPGVTYVFEDFNNGTEGFSVYDPFYISNNRFIFRSDGSNYYLFNTWNGGVNPSSDWYPRPSNSNYFDNFNASVVTHWDGGSSADAYGLSVCTQREYSGNTYSIDLNIAKNGYYAIYKATNGSYETLVDWTSSFLPNIDGQNNKLAIEKEANSFRFFINDIEVEQLSIDDFSGGGIAVGSTDNVDVSFDDFMVTEPFEGDLVIPSSGYSERLKELVYRVMTSTYFWYDRVPELDISAYTSAEALLDDLVYKALDKFSYITSKDEFYSLMDEGRYIGLGFSMNYSDSGEVFINFVYQGSPAATAGLTRGDKFIAINGKTIEEIGTENLWETIFGEDEVGIPVTLKMEDRYGSTREISLEKEELTINTVLFNDVLNIGAQAGVQKIGYLVFNEFIGDAWEELDTVFTYFLQEQIDELILDLRYNPGGYIAIAQHLSELIAGDALKDGLFTEYVHNDKYSAWDYSAFYATTADSLNLDRVVIITSGRTCSASETVIRSLQPFIDVVLIGDTTCGKPVGMYGYELLDKYIMPIEFKLKYADGGEDYFDGIDPTCPAEDDLEKQFGDTQEDSLKNALEYLQSGACPSNALSSRRMKGTSHRKEVPMRGFRREIGAF